MNDGVSVLVACPRSRVICVVAWMPIEDVDVDPAQNVTVKVRRLSVCLSIVNMHYTCGYGL